MKNIHLLPTGKPSRLCINGKNGQHIYITSEEQIKDVRPHKNKWQLEQGQILNKFPTYLTDLSECKLVIMTTDQDLIADGVQAIDDEFLEWFFKNPSCEEVEVKKWSSLAECGYSYHIIIPKEEPKQETLEEAAETISDFINRESKSANESVGIIKGAKWQQERMYSEEDIKYLEWIYERMINVHNENPNYDYMIIFKNILQQFKKK